MPGLRERIAEALWPGGPVPQIHNRPMAERVADAVMVEVQRDLDELEAAVADAQLALLDAQDEEADVDQRIRDGVLRALRLVGERDAAEADAARLAEALRTLADCPFTAGAEPVDLADYRRVVEVVQAALAAHREREKEAS